MLQALGQGLLGHPYVGPRAGFTRAAGTGFVDEILGIGAGFGETINDHCFYADLPIC